MLLLVAILPGTPGHAVPLAPWDGGFPVGLPVVQSQETVRALHGAGGGPDRFGLLPHLPGGVPWPDRGSPRLEIETGPALVGGFPGAFDADQVPPGSGISALPTTGLPPRFDPRAQTLTVREILRGLITVIPDAEAPRPAPDRPLPIGPGASGSVPSSTPSPREHPFFDAPVDSSIADLVAAIVRPELQSEGLTVLSLPVVGEISLLASPGGRRIDVVDLQSGRTYRLRDVAADGRDEVAAPGAAEDPVAPAKRRYTPNLFLRAFLITMLFLRDPMTLSAIGLIVVAVVAWRVIRGIGRMSRRSRRRYGRRHYRASVRRGGGT